MFRSLRFIRYAAVGAVATATHYAVLIACVRGLGWPAFVGSGLGAAVGAQVAFVGNRRYTFGHTASMWPAWRKFQATALLGALLGMAVVGLGVRLGVHYLLAQMAATGLGLLLTFAVNRAWTFGSPAAVPATGRPITSAAARSAPPATSPAPPS